MEWKLYLDDVRQPKDDTWIIARTSEEAIKLCLANGFPWFMSLDHDLGGEDTAMIFLKELYEIWYSFSDTPKIPEYLVHSSNPIGSKNIVSYLESWKKSCELP